MTHYVESPTPGLWEVLTVGYTIPASPVSGQRGLARAFPLDTLSPAALDYYWDKELRPLLNRAKPYLGNTLKYVTTDGWEMGGMNWTQNFRAEFVKRRGSDPVPYLPIVASHIFQP